MFIAFVVCSVITMWILIVHVSVLRRRLDVQSEEIQSLGRQVYVLRENTQHAMRKLSIALEGDGNDH